MYRQSTGDKKLKNLNWNTNQARKECNKRDFPLVRKLKQDNQHNSIDQTEADEILLDMENKKKIEKNFGIAQQRKASRLKDLILHRIIQFHTQYSQFDRRMADWIHYRKSYIQRFRSN